MNHQADDAVDEAQATMVAHLVLFSPDLWAQQLWQWLDRCSKRAPRATSVAMREQVDGAIVFVSPARSGGCTLAIWHVPWCGGPACAADYFFFAEPHQTASLASENPSRSKDRSGTYEGHAICVCCSPPRGCS
jgi:hypothetical protein